MRVLISAMSSGFSKYDRIEVVQSLYCYPDTDILKNKAGLKDAEALAKFESELTTMRLYMLYDNPINGRFTVTHLRNIHHFIFQDVYPFAGKFRMEDIQKGTTYFCKSQYIVNNLGSLLKKLKQENFLKSLDVLIFAQRAAYYMSELNMIHPFREGNGRTIREFIRCLGIKAGHELNWSLVDKDELLEAVIAAVRFDLKPLEKCLFNAITKEEW